METLTGAQQPMEFLHLMEVAVQPSEVHVPHTHCGDGRYLIIVSDSNVC